VMSRSQVIIGGGDRSVKLLIDPAVFATLPGFDVVNGLAS
jgi:prolyl-tRNA editing enzyme YbaK/EbsC (Cys-tRNA(Pro) deacylase)